MLLIYFLSSTSHSLRSYVHLDITLGFIQHTEETSGWGAGGDGCVFSGPMVFIYNSCFVLTG